VDRDGVVEWIVAALPPVKAEWRVGVASERLAADDPWLRVKSTKREVYDRARAALPEGLDEVVFLNERGEVCDGSITSVFFDRGQGMRTPPLACGLLPGVLRAELGCPEEVLRAEDLPKVRLWVGNALRGLIPARFLS
jgi:4-amino-4-deoxychorismate lyase